MIVAFWSGVTNVCVCVFVCLIICSTLALYSAKWEPVFALNGTTRSVSAAGSGVRGRLVSLPSSLPSSSSAISPRPNIRGPACALAGFYFNNVSSFCIASIYACSASIATGSFSVVLHLMQAKEWISDGDPHEHVAHMQGKRGRHFFRGKRID